MVSVSTVDGWRDILPWQETHPTAASVEPHPKQLPKARRIRAEFFTLDVSTVYPARIE